MKTRWRPVLCLLAFAAPAAVGLAQRRPDTYGTSSTAYVHVPAIEFQPLQGVDGPVYTSGSNGTSGQITRHGSGDSFFTAPLHLPSGALITYLEFDYCDSQPASNPSSLTLVETYYSGDVTATLPEIQSGHDGCNFVTVDESGQGMVVDNYYQMYNLVFYHNFGDGSESIAGAIVGYKLQVSSPPGSPDFTDVPTSHPFYQFIEALYASGITGGCGGGKYCPDSPVTRGQMAVFLAKALGLHFQ
jgi:hypothetical protein